LIALIVIGAIGFVVFLIVHRQNEIAQARQNYLESVDPTHETFTEKAEAEQAARKQQEDLCFSGISSFVLLYCGWRRPVFASSAVIVIAIFEESKRLLLRIPPPSRGLSPI